jgi:hypothetical protein
MALRSDLTLGGFSLISLERSPRAAGLMLYVVKTVIVARYLVDP